MKIIALWQTTEIPKIYQDCLDKWENIELIRLPFDSRDIKEIQKFFDKERLRIMINRDSEDLLYIDCDCVPGPEFNNWNPLQDKCSFFSLRAGQIDICALYKPVGFAKDLQYILDNTGDGWLDYYKVLLNPLPFEYGRIHGYPDFSIINHENLSVNKK
jgi:hypothetical protein